jgi:hypothetical protein
MTVLNFFRALMGSIVYFQPDMYGRNYWLQRLTGHFASVTFGRDARLPAGVWIACEMRIDRLQ